MPFLGVSHELSYGKVLCLVQSFQNRRHPRAQKEKPVCKELPDLCHQEFFEIHERFSMLTLSKRISSLPGPE